jgi:hypothetical protein
MTEKQPSRQEPAPLETLNLVLQLCDEFEDAWVWGNRPDLAAFVERVPAARRDQVLTHLLQLEIELRVDAGETPHVDEYVVRFPKQQAIVCDVFSRIASARADSDQKS